MRKDMPQLLTSYKTGDKVQTASYLCAAAITLLAST